MTGMTCCKDDDGDGAESYSSVVKRLPEGMD